MRPAHRAFVDTNNYIQYFDFSKAHNSGFKFDPTAENLIFDNIFSYLAINDYSIELFFVFIATVYFGCMAWALIRMFPQDAFYAFVIYLAAFSTFSYGTNGIKAGAAAAVFLVALSYRSKIWLSLLIAMLSWGFHHSMHMVIVAYAITFWIKAPKIYLFIWFICILCGMLHINPLLNIMTNLTDERGAQYLTTMNDQWGGKVGFRLDFLIYSACPIIVGYYTIFKRKIQDRIYVNMFNLYVLCNSLWVLCMYIPFNNRIAYLSWFLFPIVLVYPYFNIRFLNHQYIALNKVAWAQLGFTIFMFAIYYG